MSSISGAYQKISGLGSNPTEGSKTPVSTLSGKSFADVMLIDPAKNALEAAKVSEQAAILSTTGDMDELTLAQYINEADVSLQEFKAVWEKTLQAVNELSRVSM